MAGREGALAGIRVLEIADEKGVYCGKLLADMGADLVKIERPGGDATRSLPPFASDGSGRTESLFFLYHNTNKRSVTLDLDDERSRETMLALAGSADALVETLAPGRLDALGLGYEALRERNPRLVLTSICGFGQRGPRAGWKAADITVSALGGSMHVTGHGEDPPVVLAGSQVWIAAASCAAAATLIALRHARLSGRGQHVDISAEEVEAAVTHICGIGKWLDDGMIARRLGTGLFASVPSGAYPCKDGLVYLMVNRPAHWKALARWIHETTRNQEVLDEMFDGPSSNRLPYRELLDIFISEHSERFTVAEMYAQGQARHLAVTPVNGALEVLRDPHLAARGAFVSVPHRGLGALAYPGAPYRHAASPWILERQAPSAGRHNDEVLRDELGRSRQARWDGAIAEAHSEGGSPGARSGAESPAARGGVESAATSSGGERAAASDGALAGLRVLEFTAGMAGPWIGRFMAWCGADVIKVESRERPDVTRLYVPPRSPQAGIQPQLSPWFTDWNAGKRFVALDLRKQDAVALARRLARLCDVVVVNYSAGVLDKLGLGYDVLRREREDIIVLSSTGYGCSGPNRGYVTWGPNIEALSGLSALSGFPSRTCTITQYAYPDALSALHGLVAVMCALLHRERTGQGQFIDLSQYEVMLAALGPALMEAAVSGREPARLGNAARERAPQGCYAAAGEDRWCTVAVSTDDEWRRLCAAIGASDLARDPRFARAEARLANAPALDAVLAEWMRPRDPHEAMATLQAAGVAAGAVQQVEDLARDPQLAHGGFFETIAHARKGRVVATGIPLGLTGTPGASRACGDAVGAHNREVFAGLLGISEEEFQRYVAAGAIEE